MARRRRGAPPSGDPGRIIARAALALVIGIAAVGAFAGVFLLAAVGGGTTIAVLAISRAWRWSWPASPAARAG